PQVRPLSRRMLAAIVPRVTQPVKAGSVVVPNVDASLVRRRHAGRDVVPELGLVLHGNPDVGARDAVVDRQAEVGYRSEKDPDRLAGALLRHRDDVVVDHPVVESDQPDAVGVRVGGEAGSTGGHHLVVADDQPAALDVDTLDRVLSEPNPFDDVALRDGIGQLDARIEAPDRTVLDGDVLAGCRVDPARDRGRPRGEVADLVAVQVHDHAVGLDVDRASPGDVDVDVPGEAVDAGGADGVRQRRDGGAVDRLRPRG